MTWFDRVARSDHFIYPALMSTPAVSAEPGSADMIIKRLASLGRTQKITLQIAADSTLFIACFLFAMTMRLESIAFVSDAKIWLVLAASLVTALGILWASGVYRTLVRFATGKVIGAIARGAVGFAFALLVLNSLSAASIPRSVPIMAAAFALLAIGGTRFLIRQLFRNLRQLSKRPVVIYGAGHAGLELLNSLFHSKIYVPVAFIDDDRRLHGLLISGCSVYPPSALSKLIDSTAIEAVLLAMPNIGSARRREIFSQLERFKLEVKTTPGLSDIISGKAKISELRQVTPEELLERDPILPDDQLLGQSITSKTVLVTGAGGSIGSELCRQILAKNPRALVLFEISELALYSIEGELSETVKRLGSTSKIVPILGSVQDETRFDAVLKAFRVQTIFHAAAYKHVPIVEENVIEGIRNNVFGTLITAKLAHENRVERFILISTDKAVRPKNVMGASKRIAELICQALAQQETKTIYSMVRFGNVLGSSGSVIPRFQAQIEAGGPVTVTHPEINRYFMTIPEASQLVIQAGAMAKGGDVFVLNMGRAVKIADLAVTMVKLHGLTPYFADNPNELDSSKGDIAICFTGLRKGEKLYEELLIGDDPKETVHPHVMTATEISVPSGELMETLERLRKACATSELHTIQAILKELPLEYSSTEAGISDLMWIVSQSYNDNCEPILATDS